MGAKLEKLYAEYCGTEKYDLDKFNDELRDLPGNEMTCKVDAIKYIEMVKSIREENEKAFVRTGKNFPELLKRILGVGEDGVYFNPTRYLLELLQNVDDCDYKDNNPSVDIFFDNRANRIVYKYNEDGFTPRNVHDITGIAEDSKNSYDRDYIGEKGIGFKSVFGVVDKVRIQSGWFSFEIYEKKFTIPEPVYDDFQGYVPGTTLTLFMKRDKNVAQIFAELKKKYSVKNSIFAENLVLFLNKLQSVRFYDYDSSLLFKIEKFGKIKTNDKQLDCKKVKIYVAQKGGDKIVYEKEIGGYQFTEKIHFTRNEYESRYGEDTRNCSAEGRILPFMVIIPDEDSLVELKGTLGCLYSYLPTQIKLNVPVAIHSPFKLDASREYVDSQDGNVWFKKCVISQRELLMRAYIEVARKVEESIVYLLPSTKDFFKPNNERDFSYFKLNRDTLMSLPIFYASNLFKTGNEIVCLEDNCIDDPCKAFRLSGLEGSLFCYPKDCNPGVYGIKVIQNIYVKVLINAFLTPEITKEALDYLEPVVDALKVENFDVESHLTKDQLNEFLGHERLFLLMQKCALACLRTNTYPKFTVVVEPSKIQDKMDACISNFKESVSPNGKIDIYFGHTSRRCYLVKHPKAFFLPTGNILCLSDDNVLDSYLAFVSAIDSNNAFVADLIIRREMEKIEKYEDDDSISDDEYFEYVYEAQRRARELITEKGYAKYIENLLDAGISSTRCIKELLQNADDCIYPTKQTPSISISNYGNTFTLSYNEIGFTRKNLKAITSIAGSTKEDNTSALGEKGIGFKSIFCVASRVQIHSGSFHFQLSKNEPTIPRAIKPETPSYGGTIIKFDLEDEAKTRQILKELSTQNAIKLILCLRKIKKYNILGTDIELRDEGDYRNVFLNGEKKYVFWKYTKSFSVGKEVKKDKKRDDVQSISCYYQILNTSSGAQSYEEPIKSYVYCGLPTEIETGNHIFLDANFDLTASRDDWKNTEWNQTLLEKSVEVMTEFLCILVRSIGSDIFGVLGLKYNTVTQKAEVNLFSSVYMQSQSHWLENLKKTKFLPTYDENSFVSPDDNEAVRYPTMVTYLLRYRKVKLSTPSSKIIDAPLTKTIDGRVANMEAIYKALDLRVQKTDIVLDEIETYIGTHISEKIFRDSLYSFLEDVDDKDRLKTLPIIPIRCSDQKSVTKYIALGNETIYYLEDTLVDLGIDKDKYNILDVDIMSTAVFQKVFGKPVYVLNGETQKAEYRKIFESIVEMSTGEEDEKKTDLYIFLQEEFLSGHLVNNGCSGTLYSLYMTSRLPLKNIVGQIVTKHLFLNYQGEGRFKGRVMNELSASSECFELAEFAGCKPISKVTADDIVNFFEDDELEFMLLPEDIEDILSGYFKNSSWALIRELYTRGLIDLELIKKYHLEPIVKDIMFSSVGVFPNDAVVNDAALKNHMDEVYTTYGDIVPIIEERTVDMVLIKGESEPIPMDNDNLRRDIIERYRPEGFGYTGSGLKFCFCQCCQNIKEQKMIEVVGIEYKSYRYRPPMRMALCFECAKNYKELREIPSWLDQFENQIMKTDYHAKESITIEVGESGYKYKFTQMHLAEIQYILARDKNEG